MSLHTDVLSLHPPRHSQPVSAFRPRGDSVVGIHIDLDFLLVVPGIRPAGSQVGDQKRVLTPAEAVKAGASSLVVGRPITQAAEPRQAAAAILEEANAAAQ